MGPVVMNDEPSCMYINNESQWTSLCYFGFPEKKYHCCGNRAQLCSERS